MNPKSFTTGFFVVLGTVLSMTRVLATGTVSSEVKDNIAYIYHTNAHWNCCPDTVFEIIPNPDTAFIIDIHEHDLFTNPCGCECYFDFTHTLEGLAPGTYTARVWEIFMDNEPGLAGTTSFVIPDQIGLSGFSSAMSKCHEEPHGIVEDIPLPPAASLSTASPFAAQSVEISYTIERASEVSLSIYNSAGIKVCNLETGTQGAGTHIARWDACDDSGKKVSRGTYFALLETGNKIQSLPLIVLK